MKNSSFLMMVVLVAIITLGFCGVASADPITGSYTTAGSTTGTGPWTLTSDDGSFSILRFVFDTPVTFGSLTGVNVDYSVILGGIGGGTPRLAFVVDTNGDNIADSSFLLQWGPPGSFTDPTLGGPFNTGNLLMMTDLGRYDLGGIGGSAYTDRAAALALAGSFNVFRISMIVDSFGGNDRNFTVYGINADAPAPTPEPATLSLLGLGLAVGVLKQRRARKKLVS